jgi:hypothetical protein
MAKKAPTEKQIASRKAASERMKAMHAAKKAAQRQEIEEALSVPSKESTVPAPAPDNTDEPTIEVPTVTQGPIPQETPPQPQMIGFTPEQFQMMLEAFGGKTQASEDSIKHEKVNKPYPMEQSYYQNPVDTLYDLPELRRFSMRENFVIEWTVKPVKYQTAQGDWYMEPKFELTLKRKQLDENGEEVVYQYENGDKYYKRPILGRANFFNDPPADVMEAEQAGILVEDLEKPEIQERMRMFRYRLWLTERLSPRMPQANTHSIREEVIGGKVYQIDNSSRPL